MRVVHGEVKWGVAGPLVLVLVLGAAPGCTPKPAVPPVVAVPSAPTVEVSAVPVMPQLSKGGVPLAPKKAVKDSYFGVEVSDDYRWLEDVSSAETQAFVGTQNAAARKYLDALPVREAVKERLKEILGARLITYGGVDYVRGTLFALKMQPPRQQPLLVAMPGPDAVAREHTVIDTMTIDSSGHTSMDWYRPSPDGKYVAASLSAGGSEAGDVHVFEVATGKQVFEVVPRVNGGTAGGDLAWAADGKGYFYSRYPRGEERPVEDRMFYNQIWYHALGTPTDKDRYETGKDFPRIAEIQLTTAPTGEVLASVQKGDGGEFNHYLRDQSGAWTQLAKYEDRIVQVVFGEKGDLYLLSRAGAPRGKLLRAPIKGFDLSKAKQVVAEGTDTLVADFDGPTPIVAHGGSLYATYQMGGPQEIRAFSLDGKPLSKPDQPPVSTTSTMVKLDKGELLFTNISYTQPRGWYLLGSGGKPKGKVTRTAISTVTPVDLSGIKVVREMAVSKDGTKIPVNILLPRGATPGTPIPFEITGYGGFGVSLGPSFGASNSVKLEYGVGLAIANLRGGGEFGEEWHTQGNLTRKQNVFDDLHAVVQHLVASKYAHKDRVAIVGGSNGGLLMGAELTQHPEEVRVVVSFVGIYDMLRVETEPNGLFNTAEFGSVKDEAQWKALFAYSPYHHVTDGAQYPATLLLTGANDVRVAPWHSHKMAARLQAASGSDAPVLESVQMAAGHGIGSSLDVMIEQQADAFAFTLHQLGATTRVPGAATGK